MKKFLLAALITCLFQFHFSAQAAENILKKAIDHLKELNVETGDLLFWATNEIDSVLIQKFTDGPYSHAGLLVVSPDGEITMYDVHPLYGLRKSLGKDYFGVDPARVVHVALVRYKGTLNQKELLTRLDMFWLKKDQIRFDQSMAFEQGWDYKALLNGQKLSLYCTEFVYRLYEGLYSGPEFYVNDYPRILEKKDMFKNTAPDSEIYGQFRQWLGINPVERFQKWLAEHQSRMIISANGMIRGGGFEVIYEDSDETVFQSWALKLFEQPVSDTPILDQNAQAE